MKIKKLAMRVGIVLAAFAMTTAPAYAAVDRAFVMGYSYQGPDIGAYTAFFDSSLNAVGDINVIQIPAASTTDQASIVAATKSAIKSYSSSNGYSISSDSQISWTAATLAEVDAKVAAATSSLTAAYTAAISAAIPSAPSSYQTIVSQTGTAAPAVAGGFTATSTYAGSPTFTWARTGAGVYTLTASSAVFNTAGKTGVFITPPQNLNGSFRAVVTSSTVITVTTAVQSLAVLGLLGFTAVPTDAMLSGTMVYVQTYP